MVPSFVAYPYHVPVCLGVQRNLSWETTVMRGHLFWRTIFRAVSPTFQCSSTCHQRPHVSRDYFYSQLGCLSIKVPLYITVNEHNACLIPQVNSYSKRKEGLFLSWPGQTPVTCKPSYMTPYFCDTLIQYANTYIPILFINHLAILPSPKEKWKRRNAT